jgi:hypothetical protein
MLGM